MKWFIKMIALFAVLFAALSAVVMLLWNWLLPELFDLPVISYWQAAGLLLLSKLIFGFGRGHKSHPAPQKWKAYWASKWSHIPPEDKMKWKETFAEKWGCPMEKTETKDQELRQV
ncbi:MAG: hypothetical protein RIF33_18525 [Cyclobacteriaceae bacterium]